LLMIDVWSPSLCVWCKLPHIWVGTATPWARAPLYDPGVSRHGVRKTHSTVRAYGSLIAQALTYRRTPTRSHRKPHQSHRHTPTLSPTDTPADTRHTDSKCTHHRHAHTHINRMKTHYTPAPRTPLATPASALPRAALLPSRNTSRYHPTRPTYAHTRMHPDILRTPTAGISPKPPVTQSTPPWTNTPCFQHQMSALTL
jgi:hypothetical protein